MQIIADAGRFVPLDIGDLASTIAEGAGRCGSRRRCASTLTSRGIGIAWST
jgi:hypothetical protein